MSSADHTKAIPKRQVDEHSPEPFPKRTKTSSQEPQSISDSISTTKKIDEILQTLSRKYKKDPIVGQQPQDKGELEPPLPKLYPKKTKEELYQIIEAEKKTYFGKLAALLGERKEIWDDFEAELQKAGLKNEVLEFPNKRQTRRRRFAREWVKLLGLILPELQLPYTKEEFQEKYHKHMPAKYPLVPKKEKIYGGVNMYWSNGDLAVSWLPCALDELYRGVKEHEPLQPLLIQVMDEFEKIFPAHLSRNSNSRENGISNKLSAERKASKKEASVPDIKHEAELDFESYNEAQKKIYKADGRGHGGGHHGIWYVQSGETNQISKVGGPWLHVPTEDSCGGKGDLPINRKRAQAVKDLNNKIIALIDGLSAFYEGLTPDLYQAAKDHRKFMVEAGKDPKGKPIKNWIEDYAENLWALIMAIVRNHSVLGHRDKHDCGMTVEVVLGEFAGGDFCLPDIGHRLALRRTDFLMMDAKSFNHCVCHMDGNRTVLVFLSKSKAGELLQNWRWMDPGEEREKFEKLWNDTEAAKLAAANQAQQNELQLIDDFLKGRGSVDNGTVLISSQDSRKLLDNCKLQHVFQSASKLRKANKAKDTRVRNLEHQGKAAEAETEKRKPASLFYELDGMEKKRWVKDPSLDPFVSAAQRKKVEKELRYEDQEEQDGSRDYDGGDDDDTFDD